MTISESIKEVILLHDKYDAVKYDDKNHHVTELIRMYRDWHSKSSTLFSRYLPDNDADLVKFKESEKGNAYVLASVFNELETTFQCLIDKLKNSPYCKLETLIEEGESIVNAIRYQNPPSGVFRTYDVYKLSDESVYQTWKNNCLRLIDVYFKQTNVRDDFKAAVQNFERFHNTPKHMHDMIGILKSLLEIPSISVAETPKESSAPVSPITLNVVQNQSQSQNIEINIFLESIKDELTGKQFKELKEIAKEEQDPEKAKSSILEKVKSFGADVLSSILCNIITSPNIWTGFMQ